MPCKDQKNKLVRHGSQDLRSILKDLVTVYADAYGVQAGTKTDSFAVRAEKAAERRGFSLVTITALEDSESIDGFAFGYALAEGSTWWDGLSPDPGDDWKLETSGTRTFVLSEIEVKRSRQGQGLGRTVHDALLSDRTEIRATLATSPDADVRKVYESWGWEKVGRVPGSAKEYFSAYDLFILQLQHGSGPVNT